MKPRHRPLRRGLLPLVGLALLTAAPASGATFYVDTGGDDAASGRSPETAWATLGRVNRHRFEPGDRLLLKAGCSWRGTLEPRGSGSPEAPVVVDRYGEGDRPAIHGGGRSDHAALLENLECWELHRLEVTNTGERRGPGRRGVVVRAVDVGDCRGIVLNELVVHDVNGSLRKRERGGGSAILFECRTVDIPTRFVGLRIERCHLYRCERNGINSRGNSRRDAWHPSVGVAIRHNLLEEIPGDGIVPIACDGAVVEHNVMRRCPDILPATEAAAGIWPWSSDRTLIQFNEVSGHRAKWDGQGFDADFNCVGTVIQHNYSHDNFGGFLLVCNNGGTWKTPGNIGTKDTVVRYNVSINDGIRPYPTKQAGWFTPVLHITGPVENTRIHNNVIVLPAKKSSEIDSAVVRFRNWGGPWPRDTLFANNVFVTGGSSGFPVGEETGTRFTRNAYVGPFDRLPADDAPMRSAPRFVDPDARGTGFETLDAFRLRPDSPLIGAGLPMGAGLVDLFGNPVPPDGPVSIGVHQPNR